MLHFGETHMSCLFSAHLIWFCCNLWSWWWLVLTGLCSGVPPVRHYVTHWKVGGKLDAGDYGMRSNFTQHYEALLHKACLICVREETSLPSMHTCTLYIFLRVQSEPLSGTFLRFNCAFYAHGHVQFTRILTYSRSDPGGEPFSVNLWEVFASIRSRFGVFNLLRSQKSCGSTSWAARVGQSSMFHPHETFQSKPALMDF